MSRDNTTHETISVGAANNTAVYRAFVPEPDNSVILLKSKYQILPPLPSSESGNTQIRGSAGARKRTRREED